MAPNLSSPFATQGFSSSSSSSSFQFRYAAFLFDSLNLRKCTQPARASIRSGFLANTDSGLAANVEKVLESLRDSRFSSRDKRSPAPSLPRSLPRNFACEQKGKN